MDTQSAEERKALVIEEYRRLVGVFRQSLIDHNSATIQTSMLAIRASLYEIEGLGASEEEIKELFKDYENVYKRIPELLGEDTIKDATIES
jgi:hypothetical protein